MMKMKERIINDQKTHWSTKPSNLCWQFFSKKSLHILKDNASGVQIDDTKQVTVYILNTKTWLSNWRFSTNFRNDVLNTGRLLHFQIENHVQLKFATPILYAIDNFKT